MKEIGSEFSFENYENEDVLKKENVINFNGGELVFSGRTAIEMVIINEKNIHKVLLPSYCCDSMIEPFRKANIDVSFYSVTYTDRLIINLEINEDVDCVLWCNYFGFYVPMPDLRQFIKRGGIIIEDITHSLYSKRQFHDQSHYIVASLRKWEPILCGGFCATKLEYLNNNHLKYPPNEFLKQKKEAMILKKKYLLGDSNVSKELFLDLFSRTNKWLASNYSFLAIDDYSKKHLSHIDYKKHIKQRIKNAFVLYRGLKKHSDIEFLFDLEDMNCPLFVPIIIKNGKREFYRRKLIENKIYCPVHWPRPKEKCESNIYEIELSLVCDHRYNEDDMQRIVDILCEN